MSPRTRPPSGPGAAPTSARAARMATSSSASSVSIATGPPPGLVRPRRPRMRGSYAISRKRLARAPLVTLLHEPQVHEGLRLADAGDLAQLLRQELEQRLVVLGDALHQDVVRAGGDDHVVGLGEGGHLLRDLEQPRRLALDADHRPLLEPQLERVGDADDLHDAAFDEPVRAGPDGGLGHAEVRGDLRERLPAVLLQVLDDPL